MVVVDGRVVYTVGPFTGIGAPATATLDITGANSLRLLTLDGEAGVVVPRADPVAMGQALSALMSDARARADLGVRARAAVADYRLDPVLDRWERVIAEVLR